jgi:hypothetical protein
MKLFSPLGVASKAIEANFRELLENGKVWAKHVNKQLKGKRGWAFE